MATPNSRRLLLIKTSGNRAAPSKFGSNISKDARGLESLSFTIYHRFYNKDFSAAGCLWEHHKAAHSNKTSINIPPMTSAEVNFLYAVSIWGQGQGYRGQCTRYMKNAMQRP